MMGNGYGMGFGGGFMWLFWILLIGVVLWAVWALVGSGGRPIDRRRTPLEILEERYAKGEIDQQEYERIRRDLTH